MSRLTQLLHNDVLILSIGEELWHIRAERETILTLGWHLRQWERATTLELQRKRGSSAPSERGLEY